MKKLRLSLDDLAVDTFHTALPGASAQGTVDGRSATAKPLCLPTLKTDLTCCPCTPML